MRVFAVFIVMTLSFATGAAQTQTSVKPQLTVEWIMREAHGLLGLPKQLHWSEDAQSLYFMWNPERAEADSLYQINRRGGAPGKVPLKTQKDLVPSRGVYSRDYSQKVFERDGDIFIVHTKTGRQTPVTSTIAREGNPRFSLREDAIIFERENNLFSWEITTGKLTQLTDFRSGAAPVEKGPRTEEQKYLAQEELRLIQILRERKEKEDLGKARNKLLELKRPKTIYLGEADLQNPQLSPDGGFVTFVLRKRAKEGQTAIVPNYVTETGFTEDIRTREKVGEPQATYEFGYWDIAADTVLYLKPDSLPEIFTERDFTATPQKSKKDSATTSDKRIARSVMWHGPFWSDDGKHAFVVVTSLDSKDRWIAELRLPEGALRALDHQHDAAWIGGPSIYSRWSAGEVGWMPDNESLWFCSEESGYSHLYTVNVKTGKKQALTSGNFEIFSPFISRDKKHWYFTSNEAHPGERHFYVMPINGGKRTPLTTMTGNNDVELAPDESMLAILHSSINKPWEIYLQPNQPGAKATRLTHSTTEAFRSYPWREPELITYPARDGKQVYARLYRPAQSNGAAVVFVHGAGYLQNAHKWWSSYFREYMFHHLLADLGYTVLDPDYRASAGYGRDWRTAIYRHMGGKDLEDVVDGAKYLTEQHGVDAKRIGVYGGSYGGFITLMAMFTTPEVFAAGAALRPVTDWAHYNHGYTANILNIPMADTLAYRRSSPIYFAEGLQGALLMCHGMVDVNVHFQDTVRLAQRLIELGKDNWEVAIYPMEDHGFKEISSWTDEYKRILKLFEENLRVQAPTGMPEH